MLTPNDIRNPDNISGYSYVHHAASENNPANKPFQAQRRIGPGNGNTGWWKGKRRATAEEAAQDYCAYINGAGWQTEYQPRLPLRSAGHRRELIERARNEERMALQERLNDIDDEERSTTDHPGYVYLIGETDTDLAYKVGHARTSAQNRMITLQTGNPRVLVLIGVIVGGLELEAELHARYAGDNRLQEWFHGSHELFDEFGASYQEWLSGFGAYPRVDVDEENSILFVEAAGSTY